LQVAFNLLYCPGNYHVSYFMVLQIFPGQILSLWMTGIPIFFQNFIHCVHDLRLVESSIYVAKKSDSAILQQISMMECNSGQMFPANECDIYCRSRNKI
jgi:hypothetical protein